MTKSSVVRNCFQGVNQWSAYLRSKFYCEKIPPEPNIFFPGFFPDTTDK
jgi:hypothetical protein